MSSFFYDILPLLYLGTQEYLLYLLSWCCGFDLCAPQYLMLAIKKLEVKVILQLPSHLNVENASASLVVVPVGSSHVTLACVTSELWLWKRSFVRKLRRALEHHRKPWIELSVKLTHTSTIKPFKPLYYGAAYKLQSCSLAISRAYSA